MNAQQVADKLDEIVSLLAEIARPEYSDERAEMSFILADGRTVEIWQSSNNPGFKWIAY